MVSVPPPSGVLTPFKTGGLKPGGGAARHLIPRAKARGYSKNLNIEFKKRLRVSVTSWHELFKLNAIIALMFILLMPGAIVGAEQLRADAAVERTSVFVGEPFIFQIQVSGSDSPEQPDLSQIEGFSVTYQGGSQNNSTSVTIINGKMTQDVKRGYVFSYQLVPQQAGTFTIPSITVRAEGKTIQTRPVAINVQKPAETDNFKLHLSLSKDQIYVGEPVTLTLTWYIGLVFNDVRDLLAEKGVTKDALENLKNIFEQCEASRYAGTSHNSDMASLSEQVLSNRTKLFL